MKYQWKMSENDYLTYQLYHYSQSKEKQQRRRRGMWIFVAFMFVFAAIGFTLESDFLMYYGLGFAVLSILFYPKYHKRRIYKHFYNHIKETYHAKIDINTEAEFTEEWLYLKTDVSETKIKSNQIENFVELSNHILVKLKFGETIVIPKAEIKALENLKSTFDQLSDSLDVPYFKNEAWKW